MLTLVLGGSSSGKSEYAEKLVTQIPGKRYYIATMQVFGEEGLRKVERHRKLGSGKGFETIEQQRDIHKALNMMDKSQSRTVLLECMSNLTANEMFQKDTVLSADDTVKKVIDEIEVLSEGVDNLVIVSNNVFEDGIEYDESTMEYIKALGRINCRLAQLAQNVVETVVGIPVAVVKPDMQRRPFAEGEF